MRERTEQMIHSMNKSRHKRRRINAFITALAVLTGGNVFWELRETGMAVTEDDLCTMEAHEHSDNCYDSDGTLICGMDEHIHTADCYSDAEADTETPEVWEMSFIAPENAARQEQAALIAESQLGYTESTDNFILSENGVKQGYTRYGEWYGNPYGDWNTMFTYFCMYYAGVSAEEFPYGGNATTWQAKLKESELLHSPDSEPQRGNIILLDTDADGEADLTGIITDTEELLTVIEGDCDNTVAEVKYQYDDSQILGYVALPEPDTPAEAEAVPMEFSAESPSGIQVSASAEKGTFPEDAVMTVSDISREEAMQAAENLESQTIDAVAVDIMFTDAEGTELEPAEDKTVQVQITLPDEMKLSGDEYSLLHVSDDGDVQKVEEAEVSETGAEFLAESFSVYVVTAQGNDTSTYLISDDDFDIKKYTESNPLILYVGQTVTFSETLVRAGNEGKYFSVANNPPQGVFTFTECSPEYFTEESVEKIKIKRQYTFHNTGTVNFNTPSGHIIYTKIAYTALEVKTSSMTDFLPLNLAISKYDYFASNYQPSDIANFRLNIGETISVRCYNDSGDNAWFGSLNNNSVLTLIEQTTIDNHTTATFRVDNYGSDQIKFTNNNYAPVQVNAYNSNINVKTALGEKNIDFVHEYLAMIHSYKPRNEIVYIDGNPMYIRNGAGDNAYRVDSNDVIEVSATISKAAYEAGVRFTVDSADNDHTHTEMLALIAGSETVSSVDENGNVTISAKFLANPNFKAYALRTGIRLGGSGKPYNEYFYIVVTGNSTEMSHADIEIADGGTYTIVEEETENGVTQRITYVYDAYVSDVNHCYIYNSNNQLVRQFDSSDYYRHGIPGVTQYELTSNYVKYTDQSQIPDCLNANDDYVLDNNGNHTKPITHSIEHENGVDKVYLQCTKNFYLKDAQNVVFDVKLRLDPKSMKIETIQNGSVTSKETRTFTGETSFLNSVEFPMTRQDVIDAYVKCPNHSGLDFTVMANLESFVKSTKAKIKANKNLILDSSNENVSLNNREFEFELLEVDEQKALKIGQVGSAGQITDLNFEASRVFENIDQNDEALSLILLDHADLYKFPDTFNLQGFAQQYSSYGDNTWNFGKLIDNFNDNDPSNNPTDITETDFYNAMFNYIYPNKAVPAVSGRFDLQSGHYLFQKMSVVATVKNDANGNIVFPNQIYMKPGVYHYYIREKNTGIDAYIYDSSLKKVTVTVTENDGSLNAAVAYDEAQPTFTNQLITYRLPDTGGKGVIPYIVGGAAMMGAALMLLHRKRKEA